jgi:hypothetical protein
MHNSFIHGGNGSGAWPTGFVPGQAEWQQIDQYLFEALNGDKGGSWAPTTPIVIGGSGLDVTGLLQVDGNMLVQGSSLNILANTTVAGTCDFLAATTYAASSTFNGAVTFANGFTTATAGTATFGRPAVFNSTATFNAAASFTTTLGVTGLATFTGGFTTGPAGNTLNGTTTTADIVNLGGITMSGTNAVMRWRRVSGTDADHTYAISAADIVVVRAGGLTANRTYTVDNTGCTGGECILFINNDAGAHSITLKQANGTTTIVTLVVAAGNWNGVLLCNDGSGSASTSWDVVLYSHIA